MEDLAAWCKARGFKEVHLVYTDGNELPYHVEASTPRGQTTWWPRQSSAAGAIQVARTVEGARR